MLKKRVERGSQRDCALNLQLFPSALTLFCYYMYNLFDGGAHRPAT